MGSVMYCGASEVAATVALQQRLLRQAMLAQARQLRSDHRLADHNGPVSLHGPPALQPMEWKVPPLSSHSLQSTPPTLGEAAFGRLTLRDPKAGEKRPAEAAGGPAQ